VSFIPSCTHHFHNQPGDVLTQHTIETDSGPAQVDYQMNRLRGGGSGGGASVVFETVVVGPEKRRSRGGKEVWCSGGVGLGAAVKARRVCGRGPPHWLRQRRAETGHSVNKRNVLLASSLHLLSNDGFTSLLLACVKGHEAVVSLLLERGTAVDARDTVCVSPSIPPSSHHLLTGLWLESP
jgi:hypothetical protein